MDDLPIGLICRANPPSETKKNSLVCRIKKDAKTYHVHHFSISISLNPFLLYARILSVIRSRATFSNMKWVPSNTTMLCF